ncbi:MAG: hypothetical protein E7263_09645 [Lachnospiraceae bacterium]|nr:hypothetical protein [Lachnospiraceae bacterium]
MNKKLVYKTPHGDIRYCVLDSMKEYKPQLEQVFGVTEGYGFSIELHEKKIELRDYFAGETRASFQIIAMEDCDLSVCLEQLKMEQESME